MLHTASGQDGDWLQLASEPPFGERYWRKDRGKDTGVLISP